MRVYAETSTIGQESIERIAKLLAARNIACVDSPVSGGPTVAQRWPRLGLVLLPDWITGLAESAVAVLKARSDRIGLIIFGISGMLRLPVSGCRCVLLLAQNIPFLLRPTLRALPAGRAYQSYGSDGQAIAGRRASQNNEVVHGRRPGDRQGRDADRR